MNDNSFRRKTELGGKGTRRRIRRGEREASNLLDEPNSELKLGETLKSRAVHGGATARRKRTP